MVNRRPRASRLRASCACVFTTLTRPLLFDFPQDAPPVSSDEDQPSEFDSGLLIPVVRVVRRHNLAAKSVNMAGGNRT